MSSLHPTLCALAIPWIVSLPGAASARQGVVPKFEISPSPIALEGEVRPHQYVGVIGRAAAWLGTETGPAELWVHPFKLANDFALDFRIPDYIEPVRGADVARHVTIRPELTTITYTHATFTVRQHILAPMHDPGLLVLLDVQTFRPLEIIVSFDMAFQYAWPGAFGGQYTFWDSEAKAFVLSESRREKNGVIGSPWATSASSHPAHAVPDAPNTFTIAVDTTRISSEFIPIVAAAGELPRDSVLRIYRHLVDDASSIYDAKRAHATALLDRTTSIDTPDDELDLALAWANVNLDEQLVCNPDLGCGLVAGWGPSGSGTRPGFGWFFGGDAAINSLAMDAVGLWDQVASGLRFLARYQRDDGKITHEISQAAGRIPWFTEFPYAFIHADTTPYWIVAVWKYWLASGDDALVRELWPALEKAFAWCLTTETDGDGIIENTTGGLGAIEVGALLESVHQDIYLAGVWTAALAAMADLAAFVGNDRLGGRARELERRARESLNNRYWLPDVGHHAFAIDRTGGTNDNLTVWPATAAAFALLDPVRAESTLIALGRDAVSSDWGAHILSTQSDLYDPMHYNNGAVWPFVTGFVSWAQYNYGRPWAGYPLIDAVKQLTFDWARGRYPELLSGKYYRPLDTAVPQQFFATSMLVTPMASGMFGWKPDAPRRRARIAPQLPPDWGRAVVRRLAVGATTVDIDFEQGEGRLAVTIEAAGPPLTIDLAIPIPAGGAMQSLTVDRTTVTPTRSQTLPHGTVHEVTLAASAKPTHVEARWTGGLSVAPPLRELKPGQESTGLRVVDFHFALDHWNLTVEGEAGGRYTIGLLGERLARVDGGVITDRVGHATSVEVTFPPGSGRALMTVRLSR